MGDEQKETEEDRLEKEKAEVRKLEAELEQLSFDPKETPSTAQNHAEEEDDK